METAIKFENISKQYRLGLVSTRTLSHDLNRWWQTAILRKEDPYLKIGETNDRSKQGTGDYVWALKDIDFEVKQGDVLGIIGKNGAGKSTLLKILSRVTAPTTGTIKANGRIASLLEVGTGFHPELTGRENIYMNGSIMGMTRREIDRKLEEIVDFAGIARYIDTPVKRYSSGMTVRLGFSVAAHLDPEILVVDEVLAVGDAEFQKKAIGKMQDVSRGEGRTVLFVSHNMASIRQLCNKCVLMEQGRIVEYGETYSIINSYLENNFQVNNIEFPVYSKNREIKIVNIEQKTAHSDLDIFVDLELNQPIHQIGLGIEIQNSKGDRIINQGAIHTGIYKLNVQKKDSFHIKLVNVFNSLNKDIYHVSLWLSSPGIEKYIYLEKCLSFEVSMFLPYETGKELVADVNGPVFIKCMLINN